MSAVTQTFTVIARNRLDGAQDFICWEDRRFLPLWTTNSAVATRFKDAAVASETLQLLMEGGYLTSPCLNYTTVPVSVSLIDQSGLPSATPVADPLLPALVARALVQPLQNALAVVAQVPGGLEAFGRVISQGGPLGVAQLEALLTGTPVPPPGTPPVSLPYLGPSVTVSSGPGATG